MTTPDLDRLLAAAVQILTACQTRGQAALAASAAGDHAGLLAALGSRQVGFANFRALAGRLEALGCDWAADPAIRAGLTAYREENDRLAAAAKAAMAELAAAGGRLARTGHVLRIHAAGPKEAARLVKLA